MKLVHGIIDFLDGVGWLVGVVAGSIEIWRLRRERRNNAAYDQLLEEAARDRRAVSTEADVTKLKGLVSALERSARQEIPRQARKRFLQSQIEATRESLLAGAREYEQLTRELQQLAEQPASVPPELAQVVESSVVAPAIARHKQQRRLLLLVIVLILVALFPDLLNYIKRSATDLLSDQPYPFGTANALDFLVGCIVATCVVFILPDQRAHSLIRRNRDRALMLGVLFFTLALVGVVYIGFALASTKLEGAFTTEVSIVANVFLALGIRTFYLVRRDPQAT